MIFAGIIYSMLQRDQGWTVHPKAKKADILSVLLQLGELLKTLAAFQL